MQKIMLKSAVFPRLQHFPLWIWFKFDVFSQEGNYCDYYWISVFSPIQSFSVSVLYNFPSFWMAIIIIYIENEFFQMRVSSLHSLVSHVCSCTLSETEKWFSVFSQSALSILSVVILPVTRWAAALTTDEIQLLGNESLKWINSHHIIRSGSYIM